MAELLLELLTEEIPARMQGIAAEELRRLAEIAFGEAHLAFSKLTSFVTPRRLVLHAEGLPLEQPGSVEERRGPRVGAPQNAVDGFLKSAGLASLDECEKRATDKGEFYFATLKRAGQPTKDMLPGLLVEMIRNLPWPKSMRFPAAPFRWVRPLQSVVCLLDGRVLELDLGDVPVGMESRGHRFLFKSTFNVSNFADYREQLRRAYVVLDAAERRAIIAEGLATAAHAAQLRVKDDELLLDEVTGLVEWPVVLMGRIERDFMALPPEVLTTSMRTHQKYFACLDAKGALAPHFLFVSNMSADDGGQAIVAGNERVLRARLSDAKFFWDQDRKQKLIARVDKLKERVFHAKLGTVYDKMSRVAHLATAVAHHLPGADQSKVGHAVWLAKADLSTGMVGEFPELQGVMGRYYALNDGEPPEVADAIAEHYSPLGPSDRCPKAPISVAVALADKLDTLANFFAIDEKPTGSKDPYALRRAALGVIRLILENKLRLHLLPIFRAAVEKGDPSAELLEFFADRMKVALRDQGVRHDLVAAVFALGGEDDLVRLLARVEALAAFLKTEDGANLLVAYRRASNIVRIEEGKDKARYADPPDPARFKEPAETVLAQRLADATGESTRALEGENFAGAMAALARLRHPVDEFFNKVTVNTDDRELRANRLRLLSQIRDTLNRVADFSKIEG
ncbi:MAG TPA: glycine--tRNA ligase subunit beta [Stellaceae bacterium]|jgi:glycyl-tRNA synthetase beta chain|nr:glycine--tRNA ligase subunit beta [Stellaceae bacterium]